MQPRTRAIISFVILVVLLFGLYFFAEWFSRTTGYALGEDKKIKLARCLEEKNAILFTSATCPSCNNQIMLFGETASEYLKVFECESADQSQCSDLKGVPAWKINREFYYGFKNFKELIEISKCKVD